MSLIDRQLLEARRLVARAALEAGRGDVQAMAILKAAGMTPTAITQTLGELRRDLAVARTVGVKL